MDAVRMALGQNRSIRLAEQNVVVNQGNLESAQGKFDLTLVSNLTQQYTTTPFPQLDRLAANRAFGTNNLTSFSLGATKLLPSGVTLYPNLTVSRTRDTLEYPLLPASQAMVSFQVIVPLGQGLGEEAVGAGERSARRALESAQYAYLHSAAQNVYQAVYNYWQLRQAQLYLAVFQDAEDRAARLLGEVAQLVKGGEAARSVQTNLQANLDLKSAQRLSAEQSVKSAAENLANSLGLALRGAGGPPLAADDFPARAGFSLDAAAMAGLQRLAQARRADLKAAQANQESARENLVAALDAMKPKVNLTLGTGYNGLSEQETYDSYYRSFEDSVYGLNALGKIDFEFPPENRAARGQMVAQRALLRQAGIALDDTRRQVELGVSTALASLQAAGLQCDKAQEAVDNYQQAVEDERFKFKLGTSTILDVIQVEDQLTNALLNLAAARQSYASAMVRLRYETGTLLAGDPRQAGLSRENLTELPPAETN
jgi:outer membrane protein TolC